MDPLCSPVPKRIRSSEVFPPSKKGQGTSLAKEVSLPPPPPPSGIQPLLKYNEDSPTMPTRRIFKATRQKRESHIDSVSIVEENEDSPKMPTRRIFKVVR
jgi:hypothetical protein